VRSEELLVSTGRTPVTREPGTGVGRSGHDRPRIHRGGRPPAHQRAEHVWAAGDVAGSPQFTHASWHDFRILKANPTGGDAVTTGRVVPYTVLSPPSWSASA
jgi:probable pyridine nucleotide-disulfide oxidoreductase